MLVRELDPLHAALQLETGAAKSAQKDKCLNFLCGHGAAPPLSDQPVPVPTNRGHVFNKNAQGRHDTCSWDHALSFSSKRGQPNRRGDEQRPKLRNRGKSEHWASGVISADFQGRGT